MHNESSTEQQNSVIILKIYLTLNLQLLLRRLKCILNIFLLFFNANKQLIWNFLKEFEKKKFFL